jgi:hypothetical protein
MAQRIPRVAGALLFAAVCFFGAATVAYAEEYTCTGTVGAVTLDNIRVPDDATCTLNGTKAEGTIYVEGNATLLAVGVNVDGNVQAENARNVEVMANSKVGGSVQIVQGGAARVETTQVTGDILFDDQAQALAARWNTVGGNIQVFQNTGGVAIFDNTIDGNLQCKENVPAPTGGRNVVHGSAEDQCASFTGTPLSPPSAGTLRRYLPFIRR